MSAHPLSQSRLPSPERKAQQQQQHSQRLGGIGGLSSPKFSFRAALAQHKGAKLASKSATSSDAGIVAQSEPLQLNSTSQDSKVARSIRGVTSSSIPSLSSRGRPNSTSAEGASTSSLPRRRHVQESPDTSRASSSLGKRHIDDAVLVGSADSSTISDFGAIVRPKQRVGSHTVSSSGTSKGVAPPFARSQSKVSKLPGPPSARTQWAGAGPKTLPSPSSLKGPRKVARSDIVAEVHAASPQTPPNSVGSIVSTSVCSATSTDSDGSSRRTTVSTSKKPIVAAQPHQKPKIGTLPKLKPRLAPVKTLLDERPQLGLLSDNVHDHLDGFDTEDDEEEEEEENQDELEGPDVSRIRTKRHAGRTDEEAAPRSKALPTSTTSKGSRIPSFGTTAGSHVHRRSSSNSVTHGTTFSHEKENISHIAATQTNSGSKRLSVGASFGGRVRSSLPLAMAHPVPQVNANESLQEASKTDSNAAPLAVHPAHSNQPAPVSPTKYSSLSTLRSRGLQSDIASVTAAKSGSCTDLARSAKQDLGIKTSIIQANPIHPSIRALQAKAAHQPISTPEALIKAKKRLSGALLSSSSSSSTISAETGSASIAERVSSLQRSASVNRLGLQNKLESASRSGPNNLPGASTTPSTSLATLPRSKSRSPIKSSLLLFPTDQIEGDEEQQHIQENRLTPVRKLALSAVASTSSNAVRHRDRVLSSDEIDANLLASLKVVAQKANLKVRDLLDKDAQQPTGADHVNVLPDVDRKTAMPHRSHREASEELETLTGDVSMDLMALELAAGSPISDVSLVRSPMPGQAKNLDAPPSVLASDLPTKLDVDLDEVQEATETVNEVVEGQQQQLVANEDCIDTSCASPSLRAAARRLPRGTALETPVRRNEYRSIPSIPSTPFPPSAASAHFVSPPKSCRACPPSVEMSAKTRMRLKKALRESLGIEAHFATIGLNSATTSKSLTQVQMLPTQDEGPDHTYESKESKGYVKKSISTMLLTEDDRYLDELVSAVAQIGLEDSVPDSGQAFASASASASAPAPAPALADTDAQETASSPVRTAAHDNEAFIQAQLSTALAELNTLRLQLHLAQTHTSELETALQQHTAFASRAAERQQGIEADLFALREELAGVEWSKAQTAWNRARTEALAELEDVKVQADAMLVLGAQVGVWEGMLRAR